MKPQKEKQEYKPLIVRAKLNTGGREYEKIKQELKGQGFTCNQMKSMVREGNYFDELVVYLSKWNWDHHEKWHLYNWEEADDEKVKLGIYEAEQYHPFAADRYKNDFEAFKKDWEAGEYDPGMTFTFKDEEVEVLEVLQEEVDTVDHRETKRLAQQAHDAKMRTMHEKRRKQVRSRGDRYKKKYY